MSARLTPTQRRSALLAALLMPGACETSGEAIPIERLPSALAAALCERAYQCCPAGTFGTDSDWGPDRAACTSKITARRVADVPAYQEAIAKSRILYHSDRMEECLIKIRAASCARVFNPLEHDTSCTGALEPLVGAGGTCARSEECSASVCGPEGLCKAEPGAGESCASATCRRGFYCDADQKCRKQQVAGAACASGAECQSARCTVGACDPDPPQDICSPDPP